MTEVRRILSIDGGGIRGALPIAFLACLEEVTGMRIIDQVDLIAGTSTGGIIALGLALGRPAAEILRFYQEQGAAIFGQAMASPTAPWLERLVRRTRGILAAPVRRLAWLVAPKYDPAPLRAALVGVLGDRLLGESLTRLVIPAFHPDGRGVYIFKTSHHPRFEVDYRCRAVDVALATAAAPAYFPAHVMPAGARLVDGGIWANNPVGLAVVEAVGVLKWAPDSLRILSLGCGDDVGTPPVDAGLGRLAREAVGLFMQGQSLGAYGTAKILAGERNILRVNPPLPKGRYRLDGVSLVTELAGIGAACAREALPRLREEFFVGPCEPFTPCHGPRSREAAPCD